MREQEGRAFIDKINSTHFILMPTTMHDNLAQCLEDIQTLHSTEIVLFLTIQQFFILNDCCRFVESLISSAEYLFTKN